MKSQPLPLIVLAGSDPNPPVLPESFSEVHPLGGSKSIYLEIGGRPLIDLLVERLEQSGHFEPIVIAGPARLFGDSRGPAKVIDTDGTFGDNIKAAVERLVVQCPGRSIAISTSDILPDLDELHRLMEDYYVHSPLDFWFPLILAPKKTSELGASAWKPKYRIKPSPEEEPKALLPGHLVVVDPIALRLPLVYRSFNLAYRSRNRPILPRLAFIVSHVFGGLMLQDLRNLLRLRLPTQTFTVVYNGVAIGLGLRNGAITSEELAERLHRVFIRYAHRRRYPERGGRLPLMKALSLAKDIDTDEEAKEITGELSAG